MISRSVHRSLAAVATVFLCSLPIVTSLYLDHCREAHALAIGDRVSAITTILGNGEKFSFDSTKEKKLLLLFYSRTCPHCRSEMNNVDSLFAMNKQKLDALGVCVDEPRQAEATPNFFDPRFPVILDGGVDLARKFKVVSVPTLYCIDEGMILRQRSVGSSTFHSDSMLIAAFLSSHD